MLSLSGILNETRQYNSMFQLTRITAQKWAGSVATVLEIRDGKNGDRKTGTKNGDRLPFHFL
jgi:hypothetical protein